MRTPPTPFRQMRATHSAVTRCYCCCRDNDNFGLHSKFSSPPSSSSSSSSKRLFIMCLTVIGNIWHRMWPNMICMRCLSPFAARTSTAAGKRVNCYCRTTKNAQIIIIVKPEQIRLAHRRSRRQHRSVCKFFAHLPTGSTWLPAVRQWRRWWGAGAQREKRDDTQQQQQQQREQPRVSMETTNSSLFNFYLVTAYKLDK